MASQDNDKRIRQDALHRPGQQGPVSAASGGTRTRQGSNYGDWRPDDPSSLRGYDGSARSGDWVEGERDEAERTASAQELQAPTVSRETNELKDEELREPRGDKGSQAPGL